VMLFGCGHEDGWFGVAAVAGAATDFVFSRWVLEFGEEVLIDLLVHAHHDACAILFGIGVGGEVEVAGGGARRGVFDVAILALDAEFAFELVHDIDHLVAGEVLGKHLEVDGLGTRTVRPGLGCRGSVGWWGGGLGGHRGRDREKGGNRCEEGGSKALGHPGVPLLERGWKQLHGSMFVVWV
jgi:hypothetical protein